MKTIGIIGGLSPESTAIYYRDLNRGIAARTDGKHNARIVLASVDGGEIWAHRQRGDWTAQGEIVAEAARTLEAAGADFILLSGNTMHRMAPMIEAAISVPFLHLIDVTAAAIKAAGLTRIGLTGTPFTLRESFYKDRMASHGITCVMPSEEGAEELGQMIYQELCKGIVADASQARFAKIASGLARQGAEGVILGCTELTLYTPFECPVPLFDTTRLHIDAALDMALSTPFALRP